MKAKTVKCKTPFGALKGPPSSYPFRERCQRDVLDAEKAEAEQLIAEYRENEELPRINNIGARTDELRKMEIGLCGRGDAAYAEQLRRERSLCDHQTYLIAESRLAELRQDAYNLAQTIFGRLVKSFDDELQTVAGEAEQRLADLGAPISNPDESSWELWNSVEISWRWSWRECIKRRAKMLEIWEAVGAAQWLCTSEVSVPYSWV